MIAKQMRNPSLPSRHGNVIRALISGSMRALLLTAAAPVGTGIAFAQDSWSPFNQLETNRWERRSTRDNRGQESSPQAPAAEPAGQQSGQAAGGQAYAPTPQPNTSNGPQTYYPPSNQASRNPSYGSETPPRSQPVDRAPPTAELRPAATAPAVPQPEPPSLVPGTIQRGELSPIMSTDGSALPYELWRGLDLPTIEKLMVSLTIPPRSPALHDLWRRLIVADVQAPQNSGGSAHFEALRLEAMYRSGLLADIREALAHRRPGEPAPMIALMLARSDIAMGRREPGCEAARQMSNIKADIPQSLRGEAILVAGYCAAARGDKAAAGLLAELAREEGLKTSPGLAALDAVALGVKTDLSLPQGQQLSLIDYRILELGGATPPPADLIKVSTPPLLVAIADDAAATNELRLQAGEAAAKINAIDAKALAQLYRTANGKLAAANTAVQSAATTAAGGGDTAQRRAMLYASAESERTPFKKVRLIRGFLDSCKHTGLYMPGLAIAAGLTDGIGLVPEIGWFAETAIEANLAAGNYERARMWTKFAGSLDNGRNGGLEHWMALIDIADPDFPEGRGQSLATVERLALSGRFNSDLLHRLATVLDALEYNVPIPLWEAASRTPQPAAGHLPETGVLPQLQDASKKREFGRTVLLAMQTLGPDGADGAHMIALSDSIRALKRAGLEKDARHLGLEALLSAWPRTISN
ncbi:MAG: hypothetical protein KDJ47_05420 [Hyphomicrobiaceae bacterium]|nr:hypothetical protein [Hyphomicrobiaceae bacterium]